MALDAQTRRNLAVRIVTAVVLAPVVVWATVTGGLVFALVAGVAGAAMSYELIRMFGAGFGLGGAFGVVVAGAIPFSTALAEPGVMFPSWGGLALAGATVLLLVLFLFRGGPPEQVPRGMSVVALSWLYVGMLLASAVGLRNHHGFGWVILAFLVTWFNDTFAYFAGHLFGRHKLLERISPKKTWEGFAGGVLGSLAGGATGWYLLLRDQTTLRTALVIGAGAAVLGPLGDLVESMIKRSAGVKDASQLIPGHGGFLDRVDSLLFVSPWVYLVATYLR
jgi:phosphatidate cytidylyltransferase